MWWWSQESYINLSFGGEVGGAVGGVVEVGFGDGELFWCFRTITNDDYDDHDRTRMIRIKRINTD